MKITVKLKKYKQIDLSVISIIKKKTLIKQNV